MGNEGLLFTQPKDSYDGALPSGNAVAVRVLSRLHRRTGQRAYLDQARNILQAFADNMNRQPIAYAYMIAQMNELNHGEIGDCQYLANGAIKLLAMSEKNRENYRVRIDCLPETGWRLNEVIKVELAESEPWCLQEVSQNEDNTLSREFHVTPKTDNKRSYIKLNVTIHPCNEQQCLQKESAALFICLPG